MTTKLPSYGKVYALGHKANQDLLKDPIVAEEKVDGSQFSFGVFNGNLLARSRNNQIDLEAPPDLFKTAVQVIKGLKPDLKEGHIYRCEYLQKPKHNTLAYDRVPKNNLVLFDVSTPGEYYMDPHQKTEEADRLGLDPAAVIYTGPLTDMDTLDKWLELESMLGGQKIEGVVLKNYERFNSDGKICTGKYVSEKFKERHQKDWKGRHESGSDIKFKIAGALQTETIWEKAVQHARDAGQLEGEPRDIGTLMKLLTQDIHYEHAEFIKDSLYEWASKDIIRMATRGFPEWYKRKLAEEQPTYNESQEVLNDTDQRTINEGDT